MKVKVEITLEVDTDRVCLPAPIERCEGCWHWQHEPLHRITPASAP